MVLTVAALRRAATAGGPRVLRRGVVTGDGAAAKAAAAKRRRLVRQQQERQRLSLEQWADLSETQKLGTYNQFGVEMSETDPGKVKKMPLDLDATLDRLRKSREETQRDLRSAERSLALTQDQMAVIKDKYLSTRLMLQDSGTALGARREEVVVRMLEQCSDELAFQRARVMTGSARLEAMDSLEVTMMGERRKRGSAGAHRAGRRPKPSWLRTQLTRWIAPPVLDLRELDQLRQLNPQRSMQHYSPFPLVSERKFPLLQRDEELGNVIDQWLARLEKGQSKAHTLLDYEDDMGAAPDPLVILEGPPGRGQSRLLNLLLLPPVQPVVRAVPKHLKKPLSDKEVKWSIVNREDESVRLVHGESIRALCDAVGVGVTFGRGMSRVRDIDELPSPEDALVARILYSYFGRRDEGFRSFVRKLDPDSVPSLEEAIEIVRKDIIEQSNGEASGHIVLCVDEIGAGAKYEETDLKLLLMALGELLDRDDKVQVCVGTETTHSLRHAAEDLEQPVHFVELKPLSGESVSVMVDLYHRFKPWQVLEWKRDPTCWQALAACGGEPKLLELLMPLLTPGANTMAELLAALATQEAFHLATKSRADPSSESAIRALIHSVRGASPRDPRRAGERRDEVVDALLYDGYLSGSLQQPHVPPILWLSWRFHPNYRLMSVGVKRLHKLALDVADVELEQAAGMGAASYSASARVAVDSAPSDWAATTQRRFAAWLELRCFALAVDLSSPVAEQDEHVEAKHSAVELLRTSEGELPAFASADCPASLCSHVAMPGKLKRRSIKSLSADFRPEAGTLYTVEESEKGGVSAVLVLADCSPGDPHVGVAAAGAGAGAGKAEDEEEDAGMQNEGQQELPPLVAFLFHFVSAERPMPSMVQAVYSSLNDCPALRELALREKCSNVVIQEQAVAKNTPSRLLSEFGDGQRNATHTLRRGAALKEALTPGTEENELAELQLKQMATISFDARAMFGAGFDLNLVDHKPMNPSEPLASKAGVALAPIDQAAEAAELPGLDASNVWRTRDPGGGGGWPQRRAGSHGGSPPPRGAQPSRGPPPPRPPRAFPTSAPPGAPRGPQATRGAAPRKVGAKKRRERRRSSS